MLSFIKKFAQSGVFKISCSIFLSLLILSGITVRIVKSRGSARSNHLKNRIFINDTLHRLTKAYLLPSQATVTQLESCVNRSSESVNCDFSILSSLFFLHGDSNKGNFYAKKAYEENKKIFSTSEISDFLFAIADCTEKGDLINTFEACCDLLCFLETHDLESKYPLLTTLVLMRTALISSQLRAPEFKEHYTQKLNQSLKFHDVVNLFSEGSCSLEAFINKCPESYKYA